MRWAGNIARMEQGNSAFKILTGNPTKRKPLGRPICRWEDNIRIDIKQLGINTKNWVDSAQDNDYCKAFENVALIFQDP